nr:carboxypeptidase-like regulatory domain-containing protein [Chitinispirillaceae bacterium]
MRHRKLLLSIALPVLCALALLLITCAAPKDSGTGPIDKIYTSTLKGKVVDKTGNPIPGVTVTSNPGGYTTKTFPDGTFNLSGLHKDTAYTLYFDNYDFKDTVLSDTIKITGLDTVASIPVPVKLKKRYSQLSGRVYLDSVKTSLAMNYGIEVEKQGVSALVPATTFFLKGVEYSAMNVPVRLIAAKENVGFGYRDLVVPPDSDLTNIEIFLTNRGGTVTGSVVETAVPAAKRRLGKVGSYMPLSGITVSAVGGAISAVTDSAGNYVLTNVPSIGTVVLTFRMLGSVIATLSGVTVPESGLTTLPQLQIGDSGVISSAGVILFPSTVAVKPGDTQFIASVSALPAAGAALRISRYFWDYNGIPGWDTTTKQNWIAFDSALFKWKTGELYRSV